MSDQITCPDCDGKKSSMAFVDGHDANGKAWGTVREINCSVCKGAGSVTQDHMNRIKIGRNLRNDRVKKGLGLREAALLQGISPSRLSAIERGDA